MRQVIIFCFDEPMRIHASMLMCARMFYTLLGCATFSDEKEYKSALQEASYHVDVRESRTYV